MTTRIISQHISVRPQNLPDHSGISALDSHSSCQFSSCIQTPLDLLQRRTQTHLVRILHLKYWHALNALTSKDKLLRVRCSSHSVGVKLRGHFCPGATASHCFQILMSTSLKKSVSVVTVYQQKRSPLKGQSPVLQVLWAKSSNSRSSAKAGR